MGYNEEIIRKVMDIPKGMATSRWLEIVDKITTPNEYNEYLLNIMEATDEQR